MSVKTNLTIHLEDPRWEQALPDLAPLSNQILKEVFAYVTAHDEPDFLALNKPLDINLALSNDLEIKELNFEYRNLDKATNVLSFAAIDNDDFNASLELFSEIELGDIILSLDTLEKEAKEKNIPLKNHYAHLLIHGLLHLLGFDHLEEDEADYMEDFEINILKKLNIENPYKE